MAEGDPPAALLTNAQRQWLRGEKEYSPSAERDLRARIRERVQTSLAVDAPVLANELKADERRQIAQSFGPDDLDDFGGQELADALRSQVAFVYQLARDGGLDAETVINDGIARGKGDRLDRLEERFENGDRDLTMSEIDELVHARRITREEAQEFAHASRRRPIGNVDPDDERDLSDFVDEE